MRRNEMTNPPGRPFRADTGGYSDAALHEAHSPHGRGKEGVRIPFAALFLVISAALIAWSGFYLVNFTAGFQGLYYHEGIDPPVGPLPAPARDSLFEMGQGVYTANCIICHQTTGQGIPGAFPPLVGSDWVVGNPERVVAIVMNGLSGPIEVNGLPFFSAMPGLSAILTDEQIAAVATFIRGNSEWDHEASEVSEEMVADLRSRYGGRIMMWTVPEIQQAFPKSGNP